MSKLIFYAYLVLGVVFVAVDVYNYLQTRLATYTTALDLLIAAFLFYRAYRIYETIKNQELM